MQLLGLVELLLAEKPVVIEDDLSSAEAYEIAKVFKTNDAPLFKNGKDKWLSSGFSLASKKGLIAQIH